MFFQVARSFFGTPCVSADQLMPGVVPGLPCCVPLTACLFAEGGGAKSNKIIKAVRGLPGADNYLLFPFCVMRDTCIYFVFVVSHLRLFFRPRGGLGMGFFG